MLPFLRSVQKVYAWALVALTDLAVTVPWLLLFYRAVMGADWYKALPGVWLALLVYAAASIWEAGDRGKEEASRWRRLLAMGVGLVVSYVIAYQVMPAQFKTGILSANPAWAFIPAGAYLWYQGTLAIAEGLDYSRLFGRYPYQVLGAAVGIVLLIQFKGATDPGVQVLLYWSVVLLLAGGIISLIAAREQQLKAGQAKIGEAGTGSQSRLLAVSVGVLLTVTLVASYLMGMDQLDAAAKGFVSGVGSFFRWMGSVVYLVLYRWMLLIAPVLERIYQWIKRMVPVVEEQQQEMEMGDEQEPPPENTETLFDINQIMPYIQAALIIGLVVLVVMAMLRISRKRRKAAQGEEEIINLGFWNNLLADLKSLFGTQAAALKAAALAQAEALDPRSPRMLFRRLQAWGAEQGRPRLEFETPSTYGGVLGQSRPEQAKPVEQVTALYNQARYGKQGPGAEQIAAAAEALAKLEATEKQ